MKKLIFAGGILLIFAGIFISKKESNLVDPSMSNISPTLIPVAAPIAAPVAPKTFQFDSSTDLKMELEKVNPQILDSDFE